MQFTALSLKSSSNTFKFIFNYRLIFAYFMTFSFLCMQYLVSQNVEFQSELPESNSHLKFENELSMRLNYNHKKREINDDNGGHNYYGNHRIGRNFLNIEYENTEDVTRQKSDQNNAIRFDEPFNSFDFRRLRNPKSKYNLNNPSMKYSSQIKQDQILEYLLNTSEFNKRNASFNGIFVEAGAYDGETWSNTLYLERFKNWTGLLIEPSSENYHKLRSKNRNAYSINNCLSSGNSSVKSAFIEAGPFGITTNRTKNSDKKNVICHPLGKILYKFYRKYFPRKRSRISRGSSGKNKFVIDYMSLDIEGFEHDAIKTFPWNRFQFNLINIEYNQKKQSYKWLKSFMRKFGYYETVVDDVWFQDLYFAHKSVFNKLNLNKKKVSEFAENGN